MDIIKYVNFCDIIQNEWELLRQTCLRSVLYSPEYQFNECWDSGDELIEVPQFASPKAILAEVGLPAAKTYDKNFMDYYLDREIYYDHFWNEYGIRSKEEQLLIYDCICKYKHIAYNWFTDRGAKMLFL